MGAPSGFAQQSQRNVHPAIKKIVNKVHSMSRFSGSALIVTVTSVALTTVAWSQQAQTGQAPTAATAGPAGTQAAGTATPTQSGNASGTAFRPGSSSASAAAIPGQSGTFSDFGPAGQRQGQFTPSGRPVHGPPAGQTTNQTFVPFGAVPFGGTFNTFGGVPAVYDPGVGRPGVTQFNQFNMGVRDDGAGVSPSGAQSHTVRRIPTGATQQTLGTLATTLTAQPPSHRFNELNWRQLGYGPFTDPIFQRRLNMTAQQQQDIQLLANNWDQKIRMLALNEGANAPLSDERVAQLKREARAEVNSLLTPTQASLWPELIGNASNVAVASENHLDTLQQPRTPFR
jgi:hypothetical protein